MTKTHDLNCQQILEIPSIHYESQGIINDFGTHDDTKGWTA